MIIERLKSNETKIYKGKIFYNWIQTVFEEYKTNTTVNFFCAVTTFLQSGSDPGCCLHLCSRGSGPLAPAPCYSARTSRRLRRPCWQTQLESTWISRGSSRSSAVSRMLRSRRLSASSKSLGKIISLTFNLF